jgi:2'-5' RNA ligase
MLQKENLYFIAIIPSPAICDEITVFNQEFADRFSCRAALKLIPHVTLKAPFKLAPSQRNQLLGWFKQLHVPGGFLIWKSATLVFFPKNRALSFLCRWY